ncbi:hypothetical protein DEH84_13050 [Aquabacterium olei]|uniref:Lipopeptide n=1 Tax=Aquabacterium olei TaxID=1296669 RepID=A0A2U8FV09_9BURK|nr:hypothetical protein DEH84_13050 [Aquabacterium olei]
MSRKFEILGSPEPQGHRTDRSPLKTWGRRRAVVACALLGVLAGLSACGQKGSLYLPDRDGSEPPPPTLPRK